MKVFSRGVELFEDGGEIAGAGRLNRQQRRDKDEKKNKRTFPMHSLPYSV
jgi:hypothetical protein